MEATRRLMQYKRWLIVTALLSVPLTIGAQPVRPRDAPSLPQRAQLSSLHANSIASSGSTTPFRAYGDGAGERRGGPVMQTVALDETSMPLQEAVVGYARSLSDDAAPRSFSAIASTLALVLFFLLRRIH